MSKLQKALFLSDKGYKDLKKAVFACTLTNLAMLLPFCVTVMIFSEILTPAANGIITQQYDTAIDRKWDYGDNYLYSSCVL